MGDINGFKRSVRKKKHMKEFMRSQRDESKPCFELPAKIQETSCERPYLTDEYTVTVIRSYLALRFF